jgi:hypothetical protein
LHLWLGAGTLYLTILGVVCTVVMIWLAEFIFAQHRRPSPDEWTYLPKPLNAVTVFLSATLQNAPEIRLEPRGNFNLQIYLGKNSFASVPQSDRDEFLNGVMQAWCANIPKAAFVPFMQIRDTQTGDEFATARCPLVR